MKSAIVAALLSVRQHFFRFMCGCLAGFISRRNLWQAFFLAFSESSLYENRKFSRPRIHDGSSVAMRYDAAPKVTIL